MSAWVGPRGSLVEFVKYKSDLSVKSAERSSFRRTLSGGVSEQRLVRGRRAWDVSVDADASESAQFAALVDGFYGPPPWVWVDPWAQVTNLLSPEASLLEAGSFAPTATSVGGRVVLPDGVVAGRQLLNPSGVQLFFGYLDGAVDWPPVVPGVPVTVSAYLVGSGAIQARFYDAAGLLLVNNSVNYSAGTYQRFSVTATPPDGAASVLLTVTGATQATLPAVTWTPAVGVWSPGKGCNRVTVDGLSEAVQFASVTDASMRRSQISFTVQELG